MGKRQRHPSQGKIKKKGEEFRFWKHPLADVDPQIVKSIVASMASKSAGEFPALLKSISDLLHQKYPLQILATLSGHGSFTSVTADSVGGRGMIEGLEQHHIELFQALLLTIPEESWGYDKPKPEDTQFAIDKSIALSNAFQQRRLLTFEQEHSSQEHTVLSLQERIRLHTQAVRNWGYFSHVVEISTELYSPLDNQLRDVLGFSASDLIKVAHCLLSIFERRVASNFKLLKIVFKEKNARNLVRRYFELFPFVDGHAEDFVDSIPATATLKSVKAFILSHSEIAFLLYSAFTSDELATESGLDLKISSAVMESLSLKPGALKDKNIEHIFLDNPIWKSPLIKIKDGFFCPLPQSIFSHIHNIMRALAETAGLKKNFDEVRASYLEGKVSSLLTKSMPSAKIINGAKWHMGIVEYETDHIVKIDKTVIIVEDKSGTLSGPGLRGAPDRVKHHIDDLIVKPSQQSTRLESMIWKARSSDTDALAALSGIEVDFSDVNRVVRISVTLDDFSILSSAEGELKEAGWVPNEIELAPTLNLADFQCVIEILEHETFFVHYFVERQRFQKAIKIVADELDWLGFYLETGFNIWGVEDKKRTLVLTGMSRAVDQYYSARGAGLNPRKPSPKWTTFFSSLVESIETRRFPGWLDVNIDLLCCADHTEQERLQKMLVKIKAGVQKNWRNPEHLCSIVITPPPIRDFVLVFYVYPEKLAAQRREMANDLGFKALEISGRSRCILIGKCLEYWSKPYSFIYTRDADADSQKI